MFANERPAEYKLKKTIISDQQRIESELYQNEQKLLELLNNNDNILENEEVTKELDKLKQKAQDLKDKAEKQSSQMRKIDDILKF